MIENSTVAPGTLVLRVSGHVTREDIEKCFALLMECVRADQKTNLLVEVVGLTGFDTEALSADLKRVRDLLGKIDRFGRVAIVSDHGWVRWLSRIESALLPGISYRTYKVAERELALQWAEGKTDLPYGKAVRIIETDRPDVVGFEIDGRISAEEIGELSRELNRIRSERPIKAVLARIRAIDGFDPSVALDPEYQRMKLGLLRELDRYAVVGAPGWVRNWIEVMQPLLRVDIRSFTTEQENAAWEWLKATPATEPSLAA